MKILFLDVTRECANINYIYSNDFAYLKNILHSFYGEAKLDIFSSKGCSWSVDSDVNVISDECLNDFEHRATGLFDRIVKIDQLVDWYLFKQICEEMIENETSDS